MSCTFGRHSCNALSRGSTKSDIDESWVFHKSTVPHNAGRGIGIEGQVGDGTDQRRARLDGLAKNA